MFEFSPYANASSVTKNYEKRNLGKRNKNKTKKERQINK